MTRTILVTGAAGLVGSAVAQMLTARGHKVVAIDRIASVASAGLQILECDLNNIHKLHALTGPGLDGVVHCGAFSGPMVARDNPYAMIQVNVVGTANVLELARIYGVRRFVFCSSTSAYGHTRGGPVAEDVVMAPASLYGASKVASEQLVTAYAHQYGVDGASLRLSWVFGPRRTTDCVVRTMLTDAMAGRPSRMNYGADFFRQYIYVEDAARALVNALEASTLSRRTYNVTGGSRVALSGVAAIVRRLFPSADIELLDGPDPVDEHQEQFDITAAKKDFSYSPQYDLEAGIRAYANWLEASST